MSDLLKPGDHVSSGDKKYRVLKEIGDGGQGNVYCVSEGEHLYALKWYNKSASTPEQYESIEMLIEKGAPSEEFIWPIELVEGASTDNFGYVMPLINTKRFTKLSYYFSGDVEVKRFETIIDAGIKMAHAFYALHINGLCYRDISFGNLFVDFETGDVMICDNDNVTFDNLTSLENNWGTNGFMAPEVVRGELPPSSQTDLFSLSVVLFRMLHKQHPLQGQREYDVLISDYESDLALYGTNPIFIYDPIDATNRPVAGKKDIAEAYWPYYPTFIKERFIEAFTLGLHDPHARIRESIWIKDLSALKSQLYYCYNCGGQLFYDKSLLTEHVICPACKSKIKVLPPRLKIGDSVIMLNHDTILYANQIDSSKVMDYDTEVGKVEIHPKHPNVWGIRNLSDHVWRYVTKEGTVKEVNKDGVIPILHNLEIQMGTQTGTLRLMSQIKS